MNYYLNTNVPQGMFEQAVNSKIYVDKSLLIDKMSECIGTLNKYVCITRPRRFGKTINAHMLGAYYTKGCDSRKLFDKLAIAKAESYQRHLNQHNVIYIDFSRLPDPCHNYDDYIQYVKACLTDDLENCYGVRKKPGMPIGDLFAATGEAFIFILDEWDSIFHQDFMGKKEKTLFLDFLKGMLKDRLYVEMAYMTGVLPVAKYSSGSELNMFREYSFMNGCVYETYFGFLEEEVRALCEQQENISYKELADWYDGYRVKDGRHLFNPRSVNLALSDGVCLNYWTATGPMDEISDCIEHNVDEVREDIVRLVAGESVAVRLNGYSAVESQLRTRDEILSAMVVYGFLSYHNGKLRIPNRELMEKFEGALARDSMGAVKSIVDRSKEMLEATLDGDEKRVAEILENVHDQEIPFLSYSDENSLSCVVTLCYLAARECYIMEREAKSGKGYCDYLFLPRKQKDPAIVLELKVGDTCDAAIAQIRAKNYSQKARERGAKEIILVGISYDKEKRHCCRIQRIQ